MDLGRPNWLLGNSIKPNTQDFSEKIAWHDHKIRFAVHYCRDKDVLDLGCVQHNPENYKSRYWLHKALAKVAKSLEGMDLYEEGVEYLKNVGYSVFIGNAECFNTGKKYDVIVAGDLIEHLENLGNFLTCCKLHLRPKGRLLISTPNPWYWRFVVKAIFLRRVNANPEHTLWMCPTVLGQLLSRHGMSIEYWEYGSRYIKDRIIPLPSGVKHASFNASAINVI